MIEVRSLVKRYGATAAVNDLNFTIRPGLVTGFLGPNGAGALEYWMKAGQADSAARLVGTLGLLEG